MNVTNATIYDTKRKIVSSSMGKVKIFIVKLQEISYCIFLIWTFLSESYLFVQIIWLNDKYRRVIHHDLIKVGGRQVSGKEVDDPH